MGRKKKEDLFDVAAGDVHTPEPGGVIVEPGIIELEAEGEEPEFPEGVLEDAPYAEENRSDTPVAELATPINSVPDQEVESNVRLAWRRISLSDSHPYMMNSDGEVYRLEITGGYLDFNPSFVRNMAGEWSPQTNHRDRRHRRWTPRMERDLEIAFRQLLQHVADNFQTGY